MDDFKKQVIKIPIQPSKIKENGRWHLYMDEVPMPEGFNPIKEIDHIVFVPPNEFAGNHKHKRQEVLLGLHPDLVFIWQDEKGEIHKEQMNPNGKLLLFFIPSFIPHGVINKSDISPAILYEWTDSESEEKEEVNLLDH